MKIEKRIFAMAMSALLLMGIATSSIAAVDVVTSTPAATPGAAASSPVTIDGTAMGTTAIVPKVSFGSFTGIVKSIGSLNPSTGVRTVSLENAEGGQANVIITPDTAFATKASIKVGARMTAFYDASKPMIMIYPPQYSALVVAVLSEGQSVKVDRFDKNLLSADGSLKLNVSKSTKIVDQSGKTFKGSLTNRLLAVVYGIVLETYPMQTGPERIVVLRELPAQTIGNVAKKPIVVNGKTIKNARAFADKNGNVMVPLNAIAKALNIKVVQGVKTPNQVNLKVGVDSYKVYWQKEPISLGVAPVRKSGLIYVPLSFFDQVVRTDYAYVSDTQILIGNN